MDVSGQFVTPQNSATIPLASTDGWGKSQDMSKDTAKSGSDTERRHDFSATESGTHGQYGKYQFPEEIQCSDIPCSIACAISPVPAPM